MRLLRNENMEIPFVGWDLGWTSNLRHILTESAQSLPNPPRVLREADAQVGVALGITLGAEGRAGCDADTRGADESLREAKTVFQSLDMQEPIERPFWLNPADAVL